VVDGRGEFAGGEGVEGAEAGVEFGGGQAAVAEEPAEKIRSGTFAFQRVAFEAAGNQVPVGIGSHFGAGNDVIGSKAAALQGRAAHETLSLFSGITNGEQCPRSGVKMVDYRNESWNAVRVALAPCSA